MTIRSVQPAEIDQVVSLALLAWQPVYQGYRQALGDDLFRSAFAGWEERKAADVASACLQASGRSVDVALVDGRIAGFITTQIDPTGQYGVIGNNAVAPTHQGRGLAQALCTFALQKLKAAGVRHVTVSTGSDPAHAPARRVYEKAGFSAQLPSTTYHLKL